MFRFELQRLSITAAFLEYWIDQSIIGADDDLSIVKRAKLISHETDDWRAKKIDKLFLKSLHPRASRTIWL